VPPVVRLVEGEDIDAWQRALLVLCLPSRASGDSPTVDLDAPTVIVPNSAAAEQWHRTLERRVLLDEWTAPRALQDALEHEVDARPRRALTMPRLLTRDQVYDACHRTARIDARRLPPLEREVLMGASARDAARVSPPPFLLRPGLVAEMLRFHDHVDRLGHDVGTWLASAIAQLQDEADTDRGAARLLQQSRFLQAAFARLATKVAAADGLDDRALREALHACDRPWGPAHLVIAVGDHHADANGLWPVDLRLLAGAPAARRIDVLATRRVANGLFGRLRRLWPDAVDVRIPRQRPTVTMLEVSSPEHRWLACRDRNEEVLAYARRVKVRRDRDAAASALVFRRPLPYLYAAQSVLGGAGIPFQSSGTLPLAAEPWAAGLDLLMDAALAGYTRAALVTLLRSPHVRLRRADGTPIDGADIAAFDTWLSGHRYLGTLARLDELLNRPLPAERGGTSAPSQSQGRGQIDIQRGERVARDVGRAACGWLSRMAPFDGAGPGAAHVRALRETWQAAERLPEDDEPEASRTRRTRAALNLLLGQLEAALAAHDPAPVPARDTCILIRRWIEERTFALPRRDDGVQVIDADAAPFGTFDHARIVGLLEGEWPEPSAREIFYPAFMLERLGWAEERTRTAALRARFADLLLLPAQAVGVSVPELDQDAVVRPSSLLDELLAFGAERCVPIPDDERDMPVTADDALLATPAYPRAPVLDGEAQAWACWRVARPAPPEPGRTASLPGDRYGVTSVETYVQCPFKYFASRVLSLEGEAEDEPGLPARDAGILLHDVLRACFEEWQRQGRTAIGPDDLPAAREVFATVAERALRHLPPADRAVERVRLLGSAVAPGVIEKMLRVEAEHFGDVGARALEHPIDQPVTLPSAQGPRTVHVRGRVDRVDWTDGHAIRVVDYKTGRRPTQALQPGVYAHALVQQEAAAGRTVTIAPSGFVAFREEVPWIESVRTSDDADGQARAFVEAVDAIESGAFPVKPQNPFRCQFCEYPGVCRKDYVGDE